MFLSYPSVNTGVISVDADTIPRRLRLHGRGMTENLTLILTFSFSVIHQVDFILIPSDKKNSGYFSHTLFYSKDGSYYNYSALNTTGDSTPLMQSIWVLFQGRILMHCSHSHLFVSIFYSERIVSLFS